ncbi:hypothetical protein [Sphingopyxis sp. PET50]|uniref:hypothetical protein n=1 Tax=Sphingopyxis sp. PET50 TaxID=2976533 RepID=UPI0021AFC688|nr:hypothetical protein [Sphingopyxis sp. PET50]
MHRLVFLAPLAAAFVAAPALADETDGPIVVTAQPLSETADALAACLARGCPPDQDIAATLAHAENQFLAGSYKQARTTLLKSIDRNKAQGRAFPLPVSNLYRANARVAEHVGEARSYQSSVLALRDTLRDGLGADSPRALAAQIEVGDSRAKLGFPDEADRIYAAVEEEASAKGLNRIAMYARLRQAILAQISAEDSNLPSEHKRARAALEEIVATAPPGTEDLRLTAQVTLARLDRKAGIAATTEALLRQFAASGGASRPILLAFDPIEREESDGLANRASGDIYRAGLSGNAASLDTLKRLTAFNSIGKWVDIGFWVTPSGQVSDIEILRSHGGTGWLKPVVEHLQSRVYAPLKADEDGVNPGLYMVERYSLTARWTDDATGTSMRRREFTPRIERLDITPENYAQPSIGPAADRG